MSELARATSRNRESLSTQGNPQLNSVRDILGNLGFKLAVNID